MSVEPLKEQVYKLYDELPSWGKAAAAGVFALTLYIPYRYFTSKRRQSPLKTDYKEGIVYVYQFPRNKCLPTMSPFCLKLETWLRMADIQYENVDCGWTVRSQEGTLPFVEYNGCEYPDSALCIRDLTRIFSKESMESQLNDEQRAASKAFECLAEGSLFQTIAAIRYVENFGDMLELVPDKTLGIFAPFWKMYLKMTVPSMVKEKVKLTGMGKHSRDEVINIANDDLRAISQYLGSKHYFTGFKPTRVDATLFSVLAQIVYVPFDMPQKAIINSELTNLKDYCERIKGRFWPDWNECTTNFTLNSDWKKKV